MEITNEEIVAAQSVLQRHGFAIHKGQIRDALEAAYKVVQSRKDTLDAPITDDQDDVDGRASARADGSLGDRSSPTSRNSAQGLMPMSDDQDIERLSAEVRYINAQHELAMAERRLREARRPAWFPPAEFFGIVTMAVGVVAAMVALFTLLNDSDAPGCASPSRWTGVETKQTGQSRG
jgi:hypothetical protein